MIRGVTFDFGGTLVQGAFDKGAFRSSLLDYIRSLGFSRGEDQVSKARSGMLERLRKARSLNREIRLEDLYQDMLFKLGLSPEREVIDYIHQLYIRSFKMELVPGVEEVFEVLNERYKLAVVSNAMSDAPMYAIKKFGLGRYLDAVVISRDLGIRKPNPEIFKFTLKELGIESNEAIHVGDSLEHDVQGARDAGMKTAWIKRDNEEVDTKPDYTIHSVRDLTSFL